MKILMLSIAEPGDFTSGGRQRSNHILEALLRIADVDVVAFTGEGPSYIRSKLGCGQVAKVNVHPDAGRWERFRYRFAARRLIARAVKTNGYDFIVARYFRIATLVPPSAYRKLVLDADDLRKTAMNRSPRFSSTNSRWTATSWNTTMRAPATSRRCATCPRARRWCWVW